MTIYGSSVDYTHSQQLSLARLIDNDSVALVNWNKNQNKRENNISSGRKTGKKIRPRV